MNVERLEKLIEVLQQQRDKFQDAETSFLFDMCSWAIVPEVPNEPNQIVKTECVSGACALGTAACNPWFQERGLRLQTTDWYGKITIGVSDGPVLAHPGQSFDTGARFFGISEEASNYLFDPSWYEDEDNITEDDVIERIRHLLAGGRPEQPDRDEDDGFDE